MASIQNKKVKRQVKSKAKQKQSSKKKHELTANSGLRLIMDLRRTILHFFPCLLKQLEEVPDPRSRSDYDIVEILLAAIFMFVLKEGSRNALNNIRITGEFAKNFFKVFGKRLPHMDTVDEVLRRLDPSELEKIKTELVKSLINKKVFYKFRLFGSYYKIAVDATGIMQVEEGHCDRCLKKTYNKGKENEYTVYFHNVLEAKLICENGFCISLGTEWIENPDDYQKQDCEQKAFKRLAEKLKQNFPKLLICIVADGLYPNKPFFEICIKNNWEFIVTFKDGNLKSLWEDIELDLLVRVGS